MLPSIIYEQEQPTDSDHATGWGRWLSLPWATGSLEATDTTSQPGPSDDAGDRSRPADGRTGPTDTRTGPIEGGTRPTDDRAEATDRPSRRPDTTLPPGADVLVVRPDRRCTCARRT